MSVKSEDHGTAQPPSDTAVMERRRMLGTLGKWGVGALATAAVLKPGQLMAAAAERDPTGAETLRTIAEPKTLPLTDTSDPLVRMLADVRRALTKPAEQRKWAMVIDTRLCAGCHACTVACIAENKLPPGVVYRPVAEEESGRYPDVKWRFVPRPCMHCDKPPCVPVCPADATWKRADGVVVVNYDTCIGCEKCVGACPYDARSMDKGKHYTDATPALQPYEQQPSHEYVKSWDRQKGDKAPIEKARKCQFCLHRVDRGLLPQCVTTCIGRATVFGDANDAGSLVTAKAKEGKPFRLLEDKGTQPQVLYLA